MNEERALKLLMLFSFIGLTVGIVITLIVLIVNGDLTLCGAGIHNLRSGGLIGAIVGGLIGGSISAVIWIGDCLRKMD